MDCIFCNIVSGNIPSKKIYEDNDVLAFLDINPVTPGHTLIIPKKHIVDINSIDDFTLNNIFSAAKRIIKLHESKLNTDGHSLIQNNGIAQDVKHFHLHVIPKYSKKLKLSVDEVYNLLIK